MIFYRLIQEKICARGCSRILVLLALAMSFFILSCNGRIDPNPPPPPDAIPELPDRDSAEGITPPNMSTNLSKLYSDWESGRPVDESAEALGLEISGDRVLITLIMLDEATAQQAIDTLDELGAEITSAYENLIDAWVPISALDQVVALPGISLVREQMEAIPVSPPIKSEQP